MDARVRSTLAATALIASLAAAPAAGARSFVIAARGSDDSFGTVKRIGDFKPARNATLAAAVRAYGEPSSTSGGGDSCSVRWRRLGLTILFANFGGADACEPSAGLAQRAVVKRRKRWHTRRGLHIGDHLRKLDRLYPGVEPRAGGFALVTAYSPVGTGGRYTVLGARVRISRVRAFVLFIGAAGD
jgi:hypothetical protein